MKTLTQAVAVAIALATAAPIASFAQSNPPATRAQVKAELSQLASVGIRPSDWAQYPDLIQVAQARVASRNGTTQVDTSYSTLTNGASHSGVATPVSQ